MLRSKIKRACSLCSRIRHDNRAATRRIRTAASTSSPRLSLEPSHAPRPERSSTSSDAMRHSAERGSFGATGPVLTTVIPTLRDSLSLSAYGAPNIDEQLWHQRSSDTDGDSQEELLDYEKAVRIATAGNRSRASTKRRFVRFASDDLFPSSALFGSHEPVLESKIVHFTSLSNKAEIAHDLTIRASDTSSDYDFTPPDDGTDVPRTIYFKTSPRSEGLHFPFSYYPQNTPPGSEIAALKLDIGVLRARGYKFFLCSLVPTQFGPNHMLRVQAHVAAVPCEHLDFAERNFLPLPDANSLFYFDEGNVPHIATSIRADSIFDLQNSSTPIPFPKPWSRKHATSRQNASEHVSHSVSDFGDELDSRGSSADLNSDVQMQDSRPLTVNVVVFGDLKFESESDLEWTPGYRLRGTSNARGQPDVQCPFPSCGRVIGGGSFAMKEHYRASHAESRLTCPSDDCGFTTSYRQYLAIHIDAQHKDTVYSCHKCSFQSNYKADLRTHMKVKHEGHRWKCTVSACTFSATTQSYLRSHVRTAHEGELYECSLDGCDFSSAYRGHLTAHIRAKHERRRFPCKDAECDWTGSWPAEAEVHFRSVHEGVRFRCTENGCAFETSRKSSLAAHVRGRHQGIRHHCDHLGCQSSFARKTDLNRHRKLKHSV